MADQRIVITETKYLEGLMWNDTKANIPKEKDKEGKKKVTYEKISRKLLASDVLSFKEYEDEVVFVTSDGKKYVKPKLGKLGG